MEAPRALLTTWMPRRRSSARFSFAQSPERACWLQYAVMAGRQMARVAACAVARETPGLRRAEMVTKGLTISAGLAASSGRARKGTRTSGVVSAEMPVNAGGMTPTMTKAWPLREMVWPRARRSALNLDFQKG